MLPLDHIRLDFQEPGYLIERHVAEYLDAFRRRDKIEPVRVFFDGTTYWLADGFHRVAAARQLGRQKIEATVVLGTYEEMDGKLVV